VVQGKFVTLLYAYFMHEGGAYIMLGLAQLCTVSAAVRSIPQHPQFRLRDKQQTITTQKKNNDM
jgi:hypothetical protein